MEPLYSIGTWDTDTQAFTEQAGLTVPSQNVNIHGLRTVLKQLKQMGYTCHYYRDPNGDHTSNDCSVLVERTDGEVMNGRR